MSAPDELRVQLSFPPPKAVYNPYTIMLTEAIGAVQGVEVRNFSWRGALLRSYDVFHVHWPEILASGHSPAKKLVRQMLLVLLLIKLAVSRTPLVRTLHNLDRPTGIGWREQRLLDLVDRRTTFWITLNAETPVRAGAPIAVIPHGHYRDWYRDMPRSQRSPGLIAFFGRIRRYKGVESLVTSFREADLADLGPVSLWIGGLASTPELEQELLDLAGGDGRITINFGFQSDEDVVRVASAAELTVLPYREMHNSGATLTALSLDCPVLVPNNAVNRALSDEVGPGWVHTFDEDLNAEALVRALVAIRREKRSEQPNLSAREWPASGEQHVAAYRRAWTLLRNQKGQ